MRKQLVGKVEHFFSNLSVAVIKFSKPVQAGDLLSIEGVSTDFMENVDSLQVEHEKVEKAGAGTVAGLKVGQKARKGDSVYKCLP